MHHSKSSLRAIFTRRRRIRGVGADLRDQCDRLVIERGYQRVASYIAVPGEPLPFDGSQAIYPRLFDDSGPLPAGSWGTGPLEVIRDGWPAQPIFPLSSFAAEVVFVPAIAVDTAGTRLGKGGGWYDRALRDVDALMLAVVHDDELLVGNRLPRENHDVRMHGAITESGLHLFDE